MNMKMDEHTQAGKAKKEPTNIDDDLISIQSTARMRSPGANDQETQQQIYEGQLVKYEAEVRNHIKIEQQLKLHIECIQDKLDDQDKLVKKYQSERDDVKEAQKELLKFKEALKHKDAEIDALK